MNDPLNDAMNDQLRRLQEAQERLCDFLSGKTSDIASLWDVARLTQPRDDSASVRELERMWRLGE